MSDLVRGPRQVTVEFRQEGPVWLASSSQLAGLEDVGATLSEVMEATMGRLHGWLDPQVHVTVKIITDPAEGDQAFT